MSKIWFVVSAAVFLMPQVSPSMEPTGREWIGKTAPDLRPGQWINSEPLALEDLRGKVVLLEFWTFGCYNCRNTLPYVKAWHNKFSSGKFRIIGVHSPEFQREMDITNVRREVKQLGIGFAVVTDNNFETWNAYNQRYWPVMYLIDKEGVIRNVQIGEGGYDEMEQMIIDLIARETK
jgi:thiol-disulfide isomerase/thioredoxin